MRPSGVTRHVGKTLVAGRSVRAASHVLRVLRMSASKSAMPRSCGASRVMAAAGRSRGARAPGQMPHPSLSSDPSGVVSSGPQQGAGDSGVVPLLAGHWPHDIGLSGPHWHGFRMSACAMLNSARTIRTVVRMRDIVSEHTPRGGGRKGDVRGRCRSRRFDGVAPGPVPVDPRRGRARGARAPRSASYCLT